MLIHNFSPSEIAAFILSQCWKICQLDLFYYPASVFGERLHANYSSLFSQHKLQPFKHLDHFDIVLGKRQGLTLQLFCPLFYMDCTKCIQQYHCKLRGQRLANNWSKNREKGTNNSSRVCWYWIKKIIYNRIKKHNYNRIGKTDRWQHDNGKSEIHMETVTAYTFAHTNVWGEWLISMLKIALEGKWVSSGGSCGSILEPFIGRGEGLFVRKLPGLKRTSIFALADQLVGSDEW